MKVLEVPRPAVRPGIVIVRNHFSLVSAGTEGSTVRAARRGLLGKARERPAQVRRLLDVALAQGPLVAYRAAQSKLEAYSPLGYSAAGEVLEVGSGVSGLAVGDRVACGGSSASHAEVIAVPARLCVRLHGDDDLTKAAYNTLGAIALQGVRQADLRLGETAAVIGLGLLGQLTCLILQAAGVRVIGVDVDARAVDTAAGRAELLVCSEDPSLETRARELTGGRGVDAVVITAATSSTDPINLAGRLARERGRVVVVGDVPTGFAREPYYRKELELRMSRSTGPGRYDPDYEDRGHDYPAAYVRWTEQRNMEAFQALIRDGRLDPSPLTTHVFPLARAPEAYDLILGRPEPYLGLLIQYDTAATPVRRPIVLRAPTTAAGVGLSFIGAGSYATTFLLPHLARRKGLRLRGLLTANGASARGTGERYGFAFCGASEEDILGDSQTHTVFVATRHDSHARLVLAALRAGKHVYVEKPLCLTLPELLQIQELLAELTQKGACPALMVGFNRRFAPLATELKRWLGQGPHAFVYRVNAGPLPDTHWLRDPEVGGGRLVGESCHFVDFLIYLSGCRPLDVAAAAMGAAGETNETTSLTLRFADGSLGTILYVENGASSIEKEYVEAHSHGRTALLRDFRRLELFGGRREGRRSLLAQDKGQKAMLDAYLDALASGAPPPLPIDELLASTRATLLAAEALAAREAKRVEL